MTVAMPFLQKLITFLWPPDIAGVLFMCEAVVNQIKKVVSVGRHGMV